MVRRHTTRPVPRKRTVAKRKVRHVPKKAILLGLMLLLVFGFAVVVVYNLAATYTAKQKQIDQLQAKLDAFVSANEALEAEIERYKTEEYIERTARQELGLIRPGEIVYQVVPAEAEDKKAASQE